MKDNGSILPLKEQLLACSRCSQLFSLCLYYYLLSVVYHYTTSCITDVLYLWLGKVELTWMVLISVCHCSCCSPYAIVLTSLFVRRRQFL